MTVFDCSAQMMVQLIGCIPYFIALYTIFYFIGGLLFKD